MAKTKRPKSPHGSIVTTTTTTTRSSARSGPGGRKYITKTVEKSGPKYSFRVESSATTQSALPDEVGFNYKHFGKWPGILKLLQLIVAILCMIFFSPPLTWFTRILCGVVAICFAITIFICLFYLFTLRRIVCPKWPWLKIEMLYTNLASISYLIASILQLVFTNREDYKISLQYHDYYYDYIVAGVLGLVNFVLYALGGQLLQNKLRRYESTHPKVSIIRTTYDRNGKPIQKKITTHREVTVRQYA